MLASNKALLSNPLYTRPAIIVLREDLDFYAIPPSGMARDEVMMIKRRVGAALVKRHGIFASLRVSTGDPEGQFGSAEQHLVDMLCNSGFDPESTWGYRALEPHKACIASVALAKLRLDMPNGNGNTTGNNNTDSMAATNFGSASKLLLFWHKPARKCWWDRLVLSPEELISGDKSLSFLQTDIRVWIRRVWCLELSCIMR